MVDDVEYRPVDDPAHVITGRLWFHGALLVDFVILHEVDLLNERGQITRIDGTHGEVHRHLFGRSGRELSRSVIASIVRPEDVYTRWEAAWDLTVDRYSEHVRRWRAG